MQAALLVVYQFEAPRGRPNLSPWQRPGKTFQVSNSPEGATYLLERPFRAWLLLDSIPRALPWAGMGRPVGATDIYSAVFKFKMTHYRLVP